MSQSRTRQLKLRLYDREHRAWKAAAKREGLTMAAWIREACERHMARPPFKIAGDPPADPVTTDVDPATAA